jgi:hypothetical protein
VQSNRIIVWEAFDADDAMTRAAGELYERTLPAAERIPWYWIRRSVANRTRVRPGKAGGWSKHLLLAAPAERVDDPGSLAGFAYGALIPNYGGYLCYIGVANWARRLGVGTRLLEQFFRQMAVDGGEVGCGVPFVIWESRRPDPDAPSAEWDLWAARTKLFDRVGGYWIEGVNFLAPSFATAADGSDEPVPLQLFLRPMDEPVASFEGDRLRSIVAGLHREVYHHEPGSPLFDQTLPPGCEPRLRPAKLAGVTQKA